MASGRAADRCGCHKYFGTCWLRLGSASASVEKAVFGFNFAAPSLAKVLMPAGSLMCGPAAFRSQMSADLVATLSPSVAQTLSKR